MTHPVVKLWRDIPPLGRDLLVAVLVIVVLLGGLWLYTGQPVGSAPLVVVESGSMMHPDASYGRLGTIDPGDLILVRSVDPDEAKHKVVTRYGALADPQGRPGEGGRDGYGHGGDVIIFDQVECKSELTQQRIADGVEDAPPPIIHRAMTWVEVHSDGTFSYHDEEGVWQERRSTVALRGIGLSTDVFESSGWVTKGDNPDTNRDADQAGICEDLLVQPDWLVGKARGEIPWLGLLKFMVSGNNVRNAPSDWCDVGNAVAPCDLFTMLWISIGVIIAVPLAWDLASRFLKRRDDEGGGGEGGNGGDGGPGEESGGGRAAWSDPHSGPAVKMYPGPAPSFEGPDAGVEPDGDAPDRDASNSDAPDGDASDRDAPERERRDPAKGEQRGTSGGDDRSTG